ncbi:MAG: amino acid permease [Bacteroidales bacterium]|nr:amino acid permease [Bacteroidales bacterium]
MAKKRHLQKELGLFDVFAISTGAMFSSGFFLLPGIASHYTGPSVFLAYLLAGVLILPAMFSIAEISTALPRSGGAYFFLDRSLGPLMGTIGGLGTYFALMFKTAFAIIGIGAYTALFWDVPVKTVALIATLLFMLLNLFGAKKTSTLQKIFVTFLLVILTAFIADGLYTIFFTNLIDKPARNEHFTPFLTNGLEGLFTTAGFVFVSYLGLTQIASVAEEIKNPEKNIPLGMILSLLVTGLIYALGVFIMVAVIEPREFAGELAPAAVAATKTFKWLPGNVALVLMTIAALAAFASTGNAGLLSSSRYPFAMGRDNLFPLVFSKIGKKGTPTVAILLTTAFIIIFILILTEEGIVKLASTFQLLIFMFINFSVIVFRNSKIESYDPGYLSPLYPFMQITGILISLVLIIYMGWMPVIFSSGIILIGLLWYYYHVRSRVKREGAIFHWFALLGKYQYDELENEFMTILKEKGLRQGDPFDETVIKARISISDKKIQLDRLIDKISGIFATEMNMKKNTVKGAFIKSSPLDGLISIPNILIIYAKHSEVIHPSMHIIVSKTGIYRRISLLGKDTETPINVCFFVINPENNPKQQLRMLSRLIDIVEKEDFTENLMQCKSHREIKEFMLQNERFITVKLLSGTAQGVMIGHQIKNIQLPKGVLVALIERDNETFAPNGSTVLLENDTLTIIGESNSIAKLFKEYINITDMDYN